MAVDNYAGMNQTITQDEAIGNSCCASANKHTRNKHQLLIYH
jgi:hypothetical protein